MAEPQERQVNAERVITKLRQKNEELSYQIALLESVVDELHEELTTALATIDKLAPSEEIEDDQEEG